MTRLVVAFIKIIELQHKYHQNKTILQAANILTSIWGEDHIHNLNLSIYINKSLKRKWLLSNCNNEDTKIPKIRVYSLDLLFAITSKHNHLVPIHKVLTRAWPRGAYTCIHSNATTWYTCISYYPQLRAKSQRDTTSAHIARTSRLCKISARNSCVASSS